MFDTIQTTLSAAVATNGTFTVAYPTGRNIGSYTGTYGHKLYVNGTVFLAPKDFTLAFTTVITATWKGTTTLAANSPLSLQVDRIGPDIYNTIYDKVNPKLDVTIVSLGAPAAAAANNICLSQAVSIAPALALLNGANAGVLDVPRNVVAAWTTTAVMTVTGKDAGGNTVVENSASGTSHTGKKAFKSVTSVTFSAGVTGATVGTGVLLGLPYRLPGTGFILKEIQDGATASAGTPAVADNAFATALTGDVRGTYSPAAAPDGTKSYQLIVAGGEPADLGNAQFAG